MESKTICPIRRRNRLLAAAALAILISMALGHRPWRLASSISTAVATALVVLGGLFAALGVREFAGLVFDVRSKPWYAQRGAAFFLVALCTGINIVCWWALRAVPHADATLAVPSPPALVAAAYAAELSWTVLLDWPSQNSRADPNVTSGAIPTPGHQPQCTEDQERQPVSREDHSVR